VKDGINANVLARGFSKIKAGRGEAAPIIDRIRRYLYRQTKQEYRPLGKLQAATSDFNLKQGLNLERLGQPNVEQHLLIAAPLMASSRAKRIGAGNLIPGSG
jgi:hypothetical protein